ncbi:MAG: sulfatase-like hydrolase/transferase, partial [Bacteroidales bacterium]|nr:sulfatase-like hydrolase/transferase [Bacteroidales bacterium]
MLRIIKSLLKQYIYWLFIFAFARLLFLLAYLQTIFNDGIAFTEIVATFYYALKLDITTATYILIIPFFIHFFQILSSPKWLNNFNKIYTGLILFTFLLINIVELGLYAEWRTKLSYKAFSYLSHPDEIINSAQTGESILLIVLLSGLTYVGIYLYSHYFFTPILRIKIKSSHAFLFLILGSALLFIPARDGCKSIPITRSKSYFSSYQILNSAATNSAFNLFMGIFEKRHIDRNPFVEMPNNEAEQIVDQLLNSTSNRFPKILTTERPNIVMLILESWSADLIETLGGKPGITPFFHSLEKDALLFDDFYASGSRSEQAMASIFSGYPAHPITSITVHPEKYSGLPSWIHVLNQEAYTTSFYFGGQLVYGNIKSYINYNAFDKIKEGVDFNPELPRGKLGIHDEYTLLEMADDLNTTEQPFFSALFTLSSHSPYDQPKPKKEVLPWGGNERQYINSAYYTDQSLQKFFQKAKQSDWFKNTLFILIADHSHNSYRNHIMQEAAYHKIPLLFYGPVLDSAYRGKIIKHLGYQPDFAATVLPQLGLDISDFRWSKNLLDSTSNRFAYSAYEEGFIWSRPSGQISYEKHLDYYYRNTVPKDQFDS